MTLVIGGGASSSALPPGVNIFQQPSPIQFRRGHDSIYATAATNTTSATNATSATLKKTRQAHGKLDDSLQES